MGGGQAGGGQAGGGEAGGGGTGHTGPIPDGYVVWLMFQPE